MGSATPANQASASVASRSGPEATTLLSSSKAPPNDLGLLTLTLFTVDSSRPPHWRRFSGMDCTGGDPCEHGPFEKGAVWPAMKPVVQPLARRRQCRIVRRYARVLGSGCDRAAKPRRTRNGRKLQAPGKNRRCRVQRGGSEPTVKDAYEKFLAGSLPACGTTAPRTSQAETRGWSFRRSGSPAKNRDH